VIDENSLHVSTGFAPNNLHSFRFPFIPCIVKLKIPNAMEIYHNHAVRKLSVWSQSILYNNTISNRSENELSITSHRSKFFSNPMLF